MSLRFDTSIMHVTAVGHQRYACHCGWAPALCMSLRLGTSVMHVTAVWHQRYACHCGWAPALCMSLRLGTSIMHVTAVGHQHYACHCGWAPALCMSLRLGTRPWISKETTLKSTYLHDREHCKGIYLIVPGSVNPSTKSQLLFNKIKISTHIDQF
jgi:hypothetical protein